MAISNYTELKTAVADWLHHTGITGKDADFITMAESRINRELRLREMEDESDLTISASSRVAALPTGFLEALDIYMLRSGGTDRHKLVKCASDELPVSTVTGEPEYWSVDDEVLFNRPFDVDTYTVTMRFYKAWDIATDTTNWLLTNHPDVYLWSALMEGCLYLRDEQRYSLYESRYMKASRALQNQSRRNRKSNLKFDLNKGLRFNIYGG